MGPELTAHLSRGERQVMDVLFALGQATVNDILERIPEPPSYSAVRATLRTLVEKGEVEHLQDGPRYLYRPIVAKESARSAALGHLVRTFFGYLPELALKSTLVLGGGGARLPPSPPLRRRAPHRVDHGRRGGARASLHAPDPRAHRRAPPHRSRGPRLRWRGWMMRCPRCPCRSRWKRLRRRSSNLLDPTGSAVRGYGGYLRMAKDAGDWQWEGAANYRSPGFEVKDAASLTRADFFWTPANVMRRFNKPTRYYRNWMALVGGQHEYNFDGDRTGGQLHAFTGRQLANYWGLAFYTELYPQVSDDRLTRG